MLYEIDLLNGPLSSTIVIPTQKPPLPSRWHFPPFPRNPPLPRRLAIQVSYMPIEGLPQSCSLQVPPTSFRVVVWGDYSLGKKICHLLARSASAAALPGTSGSLRGRATTARRRKNMDCLALGSFTHTHAPYARLGITAAVGGSPRARVVATPGGQVAKLSPTLATTTWRRNCCYPWCLWRCFYPKWPTGNGSRQAVNWSSGAPPDSRRNQERAGSDYPGGLLLSLVQEPKKTKPPTLNRRLLEPALCRPLAFWYCPLAGWSSSSSQGS